MLLSNADSTLLENVKAREARSQINTIDVNALFRQSCDAATSTLLLIWSCYYLVQSKISFCFQWCNIYLG